MDIYKQPAVCHAGMEKHELQLKPTADPSDRGHEIEMEPVNEEDPRLKSKQGPQLIKQEYQVVAGAVSGEVGSEFPPAHHGHPQELQDAGAVPKEKPASSGLWSDEPSPVRPCLPERLQSGAEYSECVESVHQRAD